MTESSKFIQMTTMGLLLHRSTDHDQRSVNETSTLTVSKMITGVEILGRRVEAAAVISLPGNVIRNMIDHH